MDCYFVLSNPENALCGAYNAPGESLSIGRGRHVLRNRSARMTVFQLWCVVCSWMSPVFQHSRAVGDEKADMANLVLSEHRGSRERLRSGVFRATGRRKYISRRHEVDTDVEVKLFSAFDYDKSLLR